MQKELLSVIISAYNLEDYIEECVRSVQKQTYKNLEIIIIDDGSLDKTGEICKELQNEDEKIVYVYQNNSGMPSARMRGVKLAHGNYVTFIDGDDYIKPDMYEKMMPLICDYDLVTCGIIKETSFGEEVILKDGYSGIYTSESTMKEIFRTMLYDFENEKLHRLYPSLVNKIFRKDILMPILQKIDKEINYGEDAVVTLQYMLQCKSVAFLDNPFYFYRYRESSVTHSLNTKMMESSVRIYNLLNTIFLKHEMAKELNCQLEKWVVYLMIHSINKYMGFSKENRIPQFWVGLDEFLGKKIVIYGAGQMGQDIVWTCNQMKQDIEAWVDRDFVLYQREGLNVEDISVLEDREFIRNIDAILIAVSDEKTAHRIKLSLLEMNIPTEMIIWKKPVKVY